MHTPELSNEHGRRNVQDNARAEGLRFPIVVDDSETNWNAWGNSMWPSVYLIDKKGYVRYWWYGELNWEGANGHTTLRRRIGELIAEEG